jgi:hypothetical protein
MLNLVIERDLYSYSSDRKQRTKGIKTKFAAIKTLYNKT